MHPQRAFAGAVVPGNATAAQRFHDRVNCAARGFYEPTVVAPPAQSFADLPGHGWMDVTGPQKERDGNFARRQLTVEQVAVDNGAAVFEVTKGQAINREAATPAVGIWPFQCAPPPHQIAAGCRLPDGSLEYFAPEPLTQGPSHLAGAAAPRPILVGV